MAKESLEITETRLRECDKWLRHIKDCLSTCIYDVQQANSVNTMFVYLQRAEGMVYILKNVSYDDSLKKFAYKVPPIIDKFWRDFLREYDKRREELEKNGKSNT